MNTKESRHPNKINDEKTGKKQKRGKVAGEIST
jgi:hypothetical protein